MSYFKNGKRGDITISLSWIFMIVIGTFFLYSAYSIIGTYQENEETKFYIEVKNLLSNILTNAAQTIGYEENYIQPINDFFKDSKVEIICNDGLSILSINERMDDSVDFLKNIPTFMTSINEGDVSFTYLAVENFRAPFKVTNMMALVSKKNLIVFDKDSEITTILREKFAKSAYRDSLSFSETPFGSISSTTYNKLVKDYNYNTIMFVSDSEENLGAGFNLDDIVGIDSYYLKVSGKDDDFKFGKLTYLDKLGGNFEYNYVDFRNDVFDSKPINLITMGIFSRPETFECGQKLLIDNTLNVLNFYINKTANLMKLSESTQVCSSDYFLVSGDGSVDGTFQTIKYENLMKELVDFKNEIETHRFNNPEDIFDSITEIHRLSQILSDSGCELIY